MIKSTRLLMLAGSSLCSLLTGCASTRNTTTIPTTEDGHLILENERLQLHLPDPTAAEPYYQGQRFTLPGMVIGARWQGVDMFTELGLPNRNPKAHDHVGGTAEEFDINGPADYDDTPVGGAFMKIGVGLLRREDDGNYRFSRAHEVVRAPKNEVEVLDRQTIRFIQTLEDTDGDRGYLLRVTVQLQENGFTVSRTLQNLGGQPLETEHYSHNFIQIDGLPVGPDYRIHWPIPLEVAQANSRQNVMTAEPTGISFAAIPEGHYYYASEAGSGLPADQPIKLDQLERGLRLRIINDRPLHRVAIWGGADVICPEPFVKLLIAPGETIAWNTTYEIAGIEE